MRECTKYSLKISRDEIEKLKKFVQDTILLLENLPHHEIEVTLDEFRVQEQKKHLKSNEKDSFGCQKSSKTAPNRPKKDQISP